MICTGSNAGACPSASPLAFCWLMTSVTDCGIENGRIIELPKNPSTLFCTQSSSGIICEASAIPFGGTPMVYWSSRIARSSSVSDAHTAFE